MSDFDALMSTRQVTIGDIIGTTAAVVVKNFVPLFMLAALLYLPVLIYQQAGVAGLIGTGADLDIGDYMIPAAPDYVGLIATFLIGLLLQAALVAAMTWAVFEALRGNSISLTGSLSQGFARMLPVVGVSLLSSLAMVVGLVLLIIPGIIVMILLSVSVPAVVVERISITKALDRSMALTRGYRWMILGLFLVGGSFCWQSSLSLSCSSACLTL